MKANGLLLFTLLLAACGRQDAPLAAEPAQPAMPAHTAAAPAPAQSAETAQQFWSEFRAAALANDVGALQRMARFPFTTRGETDDDPVVTHEAAAFAQLLPKILSQDTGLRAEPETVRDYLERNAELPRVATGGGESAPVAADAAQFTAGPLTFERDGPRWRWVSAYVAE